MKRILLLLGVVLLSVGTTRAQDWKDFLKKAADAVADKVSEGKFSERELIGEWTYSSPGVKFEGDGLAELAGAVMEGSISKRMEKAYAKVGLKPGVGTLTFDKEGRFTASTKEHSIKGGYTFDASKHEITFTFDSRIKKYEPITGHAQISGGKLIIVFPVKPLVDRISELGSRFSSFSSIAKLLEQYKEVYAGFAFEKGLPATEETASK